ncbi:MAG: peroxiredoxin [Ignavibacteria bacterium]|nr:peroxiredoxin [Ignavibacteria bacterium]
MMHIGSNIPGFLAHDQFRQPFSPSLFTGKANVIIYFYNRDFNFGCTNQACAFRDNAALFKAFNTEIIGISADTPERHEEFSREYGIPFRLLSDPRREIRDKFHLGSYLSLFQERASFLFDMQGTLVYRYSSQWFPGGHARALLSFLHSFRSFRK